MSDIPTRSGHGDKSYNYYNQIQHTRMAPKDKLFDIERGLDITKEGGNYFFYDHEMALVGGPFQNLTTARREARRMEEMYFPNQRK